MLEQKMISEGYTVSKLHGNLRPEERDAVMEAFRQVKTKVLITTNVLARGMDIAGVNLVVNYDPPFKTVYPDPKKFPDAENYIHRIGRCGRFGRKGIAISFVADQTDLQLYSEIEEMYNFKLTDAPEDVEELAEMISKM